MSICLLYSAHFDDDEGGTLTRKKRARSDVIVVRYADDIVVGFELKDEAERFWAELKERMQKFRSSVE